MPKSFAPLRLCAFALSLLAGFAVYGQPTNRIVSNDLSVMTDTNGAVIAPAHFFDTNAAAIQAALTNTYLLANGGCGTNETFSGVLAVTNFTGNTAQINLGGASSGGSVWSFATSPGGLSLTGTANSTLHLGGPANPVLINTNLSVNGNAWFGGSVNLTNGAYLQIFANNLAQSLQSVWTNNVTGAYFGVSTNAALHAYRAQVATNLSAGLLLTNLTAAATNAPQNSPAIVQYANIWEGALNSVAVAFASQVSGVQNSGSAAQPAGVWSLYGTTNGFANSNRVFSVDHAGNATNLATLRVGSNFAQIGVITTNFGVAQEMAAYKIAGQTNTLTSQTVYTTLNDGSSHLYRIHGGIYVTTAGSAGTVTVTATWTDPDLGSTTHTLLTSINLSSATAVNNGTFLVEASANTAIQSTATVSGNTGGAGVFKFLLEVDRL